MAFLQIMDLGRYHSAGARLVVQRNSMFASENLKAGQEIQSNWPIVCSETVWGPYGIYPNPHCEYCLNGLETPVDYVERLTHSNHYTSFLEKQDAEKVNGTQYRPLPCREGCKVLYCNDACRNFAWNSYHKRLCPSTNFEKRTELEVIAQMWRGFENNNNLFDVFLLLKILALDNHDTVYELFNLLKQESTEASVRETRTFIHRKFGDRFGEFTTLVKNFGETQKFTCHPEIMTSDGITAIIHTILASKIEVNTSCLTTWKDQYISHVQSSISYISDFRLQSSVKDVDRMVKNLETNITTKSRFNHAGHAIFSVNCHPKGDQEFGNCELKFLLGSSQAKLTALQDIRKGEELLLKSHYRESYYVPCKNPSKPAVVPSIHLPVEQTHIHKRQEAMDNTEMMEIEETEVYFCQENDRLRASRRRPAPVILDRRNTGATAGGLSGVPANTDHEPPPASRRRLETFNHLAQHIHTKEGMAMALYEVITSDFELTPNIGPEVGALRRHFANRLEIPVDSVSIEWFGICLNFLYNIKSVQKMGYDANHTNKQLRRYYPGLEAKLTVGISAQKNKDNNNYCPSNVNFFSWVEGFISELA